MIILLVGQPGEKIRALVNDKGTTIEQAIPSTPVEILGMNGPAKAGDDFIVVENESKAKEINAYRKGNLQSEKNSLVFCHTRFRF